MYQFTRNKQTGNFDVIGPASRMTEGATVDVTKANGEKKSVTLGKVSKAFVAKFGPHKGEQVAIASVVTRSRNNGRCRGCRGPIVDAPAHRAMEGYCGYCAFDEFDM